MTPSRDHLRLRLLPALLLTALTAAAPAQVLFSLSNPEACYAKDLHVDHDGNILLPVYFGGTVDFDPGPGSAPRTAAGFIDNGLAKYTPSGALLWAVNWGTSAVSPEIPHGLEVDSSNNIYVSGYFTGTADFDPGPGVTTVTSNGDRDAYLVKFTPSGTLAWARGFGGPGTGTTAYDQGWGVDVDAAGNSVQVGFFNGTTNDIDPGPGTTTLSSAGDTDIFLIKRDTAGALLWGFGLGSTGADAAMAARMDTSGDIIVAGNFTGTVDFDPAAGTSTLTSAGNTDIYVARYSSAGALLSCFRIGGGAADSPIAGGLMIGSGGTLHVCGNFQTTVDFDPGPGVSARTSAGIGDAFIARYSSSGAFGWAVAFGGTGNDGAHRMALDSSGNVYATGYFTGSPDFDPGPGTHVITAKSSGTDMFVASYSPAGAFRWANGFGDPAATSPSDTTLGTGIDLDAGGNVLVTGPFFGSIDFDPSDAAQVLTSAGAEDSVLAQFNASTGLLTPSAFVSGWECY